MHMKTAEAVTRPALFANWYPEDLSEVARYLPKPKHRSRSPVTFAIAPHSGWEYSGKVAGSVYAAFPKFDTAIFIGSNHRGLGPPVSLFASGAWEMPAGYVEIDEDFCKDFLGASRNIQADVSAHMREHAVEVQVPFVQYLNPRARIVPVEVRDSHWEACQELGEALAAALYRQIKKDPKKTFCVIGSTDMTHCGARYGQEPEGGLSPEEFARRQDSLAIEKILNLDTAGFLDTVENLEISMCGPGTAAVVMAAAIEFGVKKAHLTAYSTSCENSEGDSDSCVGFGGIVIE